MSYYIPEDDDDDYCEPSLEDQYEDLVEDMMLYPQNYSTKQIEMVGLTLDDVYPKEDIDDIPSVESVNFVQFYSTELDEAYNEPN